MCNVSYHTGEHKGYSSAPCAKCNNNLAGDRWEWFVLRQGRTHGVKAERKGEVCVDCFDEINHNK